MKTLADQEIEACLDRRQSLLLDAGAGAGKTTSLVGALNYIRDTVRPTLAANRQKVACITFTNVAKNEIIERIEHDSLFQVSTIHDFLWGVIRPFQRELKQALLQRNEELSSRSRRKQDQKILRAAVAESAFKVSYSDRGANFLEGRIFHDDLLKIAAILLADYPALCRILAAHFPFIFVDEYQDTQDIIIPALLESLLSTPAAPMVGLFGDKLQSIYPGGIGQIPDQYLPKLAHIKKLENYRCSLAVIALLNRLRSDIKQEPAGKNLPGSAVYVDLSVEGSSDDLVERVRQRVQTGFGLTLEGEIKVLFLTHRLIARKAGYENLWRVYDGRGGFVRERFQSGEDLIANFFCDELQPLAEAWKAKNPGQAISLMFKKSKLAITKADKVRLSVALNDLIRLVEMDTPIQEIVRHVFLTRLLPLPDDLDAEMKGNCVATVQGSSEAEHQAFIAGLLATSYQEMLRYRSVLLEHLPFSTKHGVKGAEFENVLVVLDDQGANWNQYSFNNLLSGHDTRQGRIDRTRNLFYVCCSRAKNNLIVANLAPAGPNAAAITALFGKHCVSL